MARRGRRKRQGSRIAAIGNEGRHDAEIDRRDERLCVGDRRLLDAGRQHRQRATAPMTIFQAETASGLCARNSGFCTMAVEAVRKAAPRMGSAPLLIFSPSPSPSAVSAITGEGNEGAEPGQPREAFAEREHGHDGHHDRVRH